MKQIPEMTAEESFANAAGKEFDKLAGIANPGKFQWYKDRPYMDAFTRHSDLHRDIVNYYKTKDTKKEEQ